MDCSKISDQLGFYIDGTLDEQKLEQMEAHLADCASCRAELASLKMLIGVAAQIEEIDPPSTLRAKIAAATTGGRDTEAARMPMPARLREMLSPRALRWASGFAGAAVAIVVAFVALTHSVAPTVSRLHAPALPVASIQNKAPARIALAPVPAASTRALPSSITSKHAAHRTLGTVTRKAAAPSSKLVSKVKTRNTREPRSASATEPVDDIALLDNTTVAQTVTPSDIVEPAPKISETGAKQDLSKLVEVASSPALKGDNTEQWMKQMKEQAAMRRRDHGSVGMSLINARF